MKMFEALKDGIEARKNGTPIPPATVIATNLNSLVKLPIDKKKKERNFLRKSAKYLISVGIDADSVKESIFAVRKEYQENETTFINSTILVNRLRADGLVE